VLRLLCWLVFLGRRVPRGLFVRRRALEVILLMTWFATLWHMYLMVLSMFARQQMIPTGRLVAVFLAGPAAILLLNCFAELQAIRMLHPSAEAALRPFALPKAKPRFLHCRVTHSSLDMRKEGALGDSTCAVCLDDFEPESVVSQLACRHLFHDECIQRWLDSQPTCPFRCSQTDVRDEVRPDTSPDTEPLDVNHDLVSDVFEGDGSEIVPRSEPEFSEQDVVEAPCSDDSIVVRLYDGVRPDTSPGTGPLDMNLDLVSDVFEGDGSEIVPRSEPEFSEQDVVEAPCSDDSIVVRLYDGVRPDTSPGTGPLDVNLDLVSDVFEGEGIEIVMRSGPFALGEFSEHSGQHVMEPLC